MAAPDSAENNKCTRGASGTHLQELSQAKDGHEGPHKKDFDWFEETGEFGFDDLEERTAARPTRFARLNKKLVPAAMSISASSLLLFLAANAVPLRFRTLYGVDVKDALFVVLFLSFTFLLIKLLVHGLSIAVAEYWQSAQVLRDKHFKLYAVLAIWFVVVLASGHMLRTLIPWLGVFSQKVAAAGLVTLGLFSLKQFVMTMFRSYFLGNTLRAKAGEVEKKECIIHAFREYCYEENEEAPSEHSPVCFFLNCDDGDEEKDEAAGQPVFDQGTHLRGDISNILLGTTITGAFLQGKTMTLHETKSLARDTFLKCSTDGLTIGFESFCQIFPCAQSAVQAFLCFDTNNSKFISRKDLRDGLIRFYHDRRNLETSFESLNNFVEVLDTSATIIILIPLLIIYLALAGMPVVQLLTFSLSSALVLNFMVGGIAKEFYLNASFIFTHPFDIGDEILVDGKDYSVYSLSLYKTEVLSSQGGKVSFLNKVLWNKSVINMSRAPQKLIHLTFALEPSLTLNQFKEIKRQLLLYLRENSSLFYETFSIHSESETVCHLKLINCSLVIRCKSVNNKMAKLELKLRIIREVTDILQSLGIAQK